MGTPAGLGAEGHGRVGGAEAGGVRVDVLEFEALLAGREVEVSPPRACDCADSPPFFAPHPFWSLLEETAFGTAVPPGGGVGDATLRGWPLWDLGMFSSVLLEFSSPLAALAWAAAFSSWNVFRSTVTQGTSELKFCPTAERKSKSNSKLQSRSRNVKN